MGGEWQEYMVRELQEIGQLLVEDGNHGEYRPRRDEFCKDGAVFIRAADIDRGRVLFDSASKINGTAVARIRKGIGVGGDVLLSHKGTVGKLAMVPLDAPPFVCSPQTTFWRALNPDAIDRRYLYAYMHSPHFRQQLDSRKGETDMADYVSLTAQREFRVLLPPIADQRAIGHILGSLDDKIELNRRMNETLEAMAQAIFKSWFVDFDPVCAKAEGRDTGLPRDLADLFPDSFEDSERGAVPGGWKATTLKDGIEIFDSVRIPLNKRQRAERQGPYPYYGAAGIVDHVDDFLFDGVYVLTGEDGSVVDGDGYPVVQYVWGQFWANNHAHILRGKNGISEEHLYLFLQQTNVAAFVTGAVQPKLNQKNLKAVPFVLPKGPVCRAFSDLIRPLFSELRANADETATLATLRDILLPKLLSGELRVSDAEKFIEEGGVGV